MTKSRGEDSAMEFDKLSGATGVAFVDVRGLEQQIRAQVTAFLF